MNTNNTSQNSLKSSPRQGFLGHGFLRLLAALGLGIGIALMTTGCPRSVENAADDAGDAIDAAGEKAAEATKGALEGSRDAIKDGADAVGDAAENAADSVRDAADDAVDATKP